MSNFENRFEQRFKNLNIPQSELDRMYKIEQEYQLELNWISEQANLNQRGAVNPVIGFDFVSNSVIYYQLDSGSGTIISAAGLC